MKLINEEEKETYENDSIDETINLASYSPCRTLFTVAYINDQLSIVNRLTFDICMNYSSKDVVYSLAWNPSESDRFTCSTMAEIKGEYAHVDINEYLSKPTSTSSDKKEPTTEIEKMTTNIEDDDAESVSNESEQVTESKELISTYLERASSMVVKTKLVELQESLQSISTSKYLESRFLIWNNIGASHCAALIVLTTRILSKVI